jgi:hypothetical protein
MKDPQLHWLTLATLLNLTARSLARPDYQKVQSSTNIRFCPFGVDE